MPGLLDFLGMGGGQPLQSQMPGQDQQPRGLGGFMQNISDPSIALPLAAALMQPGDFGANLGQGFAAAGQGVASSKKLKQERAQQNATAQWLQAQGADAGLVELAKSGGGAQALQMYQASKRDPANELNMEKTRLQIEQMRNPQASAPSYGLNPIYGTDAQGNTVLGQLADNGTFQPLKMPEGFKPSGGTQTIDTGTGYQTRDRRSGADMGFIAKDVAGEAAQGVLGKAQGEAQANLPNVVANAEQSLAIIKDLQSDPNRQWATGKSSTFNILPGTGGYDYKQKVNQLKGKAFLEAYSGLKGTGAISEIEGVKAEQAVARLDTAQTEEGFSKALGDLEEVVTNGIARARAKAGGGQQQMQQMPQQQAPQGNATSTGVQWSIEQ